MTKRLRRKLIKKHEAEANRLAQELEQKRMAVQHARDMTEAELEKAHKDGDISLSQGTSATADVSISGDEAQGEPSVRGEEPVQFEDAQPRTPLIGANIDDEKEGMGKLQNPKVQTEHSVAVMNETFDSLIGFDDSFSGAAQVERVNLATSAAVNLKLDRSNRILSDELHNIEKLLHNTKAWCLSQDDHDDFKELCYQTYEQSLQEFGLDEVDEKQELRKTAETGEFDIQGGKIGNMWARLPKDNPYKLQSASAVGRAAKKAARAAWAKEEFAYVLTEKTHEEAYREVDQEIGTMHTFGGLVRELGGWEWTEAVMGAKMHFIKALRMGGKWCKVDRMCGLIVVLRLNPVHIEIMERKWARFTKFHNQALSNGTLREIEAANKKPAGVQVDAVAPTSAAEEAGELEVRPKKRKRKERGKRKERERQKLRRVHLVLLTLHHHRNAADQLQREVVMVVTMMKMITAMMLISWL